PQLLSIAEATADPANAGRYIAVTGQATRIEEFTYSYEIDLTDDAGNTLLLYVDKLTNLNTDDLNVGDRYTISGVLEFYQGKWQLKPRTPDDFQQVFPPVLRLTLEAPNTVQPGATLVYTLTAFNHTDASLTRLVITSAIPAPLAEVYDGGIVEGDTLRWEFPTLPPGGDFVRVHFSVTAPPDGEQIVHDRYGVTALEWPEPVTGPPFRTFIGQTVPIWAVQGEGLKSPYVNSTLQTEGIVTAIFDPEDIPGFFIQEVETDDDPATSAGLFVRAEDFPAGLAPGDRVRVTGRVKELSGQTELHLADLTVLAHGIPLPDPVPLNPPEAPDEAIRYYESLEGMLVRAGGIAVSPISKYGETNLVRPEWHVEHVLRGEAAGFLITLDDGSWTERYDDASILPYAIVTGDAIADVTGPLAYTFGQYKVEPLAPPDITPGDFERAPTLPEVGEDGFSVATYNVENFFDDKEPNPSSPPRPSHREYLHKALKIANSIAAMGYPTLIAFAEVENVDALQTVAEQPPLAGYPYQPVLIEGRDSRGIDVGYLVRTDRAEILSTTLRLDDEGLFTRGPLVLQTRIRTTGGDVTLYTIANHWVSLGGGFETTESRRLLQAQWNLDIAAEIQAQDPEANIAILGDLNTFFDAPSIQLMRDAGFVHVFDALLPEERYTYIYQGEAETLDHVLVSPALARRITGVTVLHINADFPPANPADDSPRRTSDHDPVVVWFAGQP
ncbi:MAG: hypothetical protein D6796_12730, partial [Caldilineae bacterium]